MPYPLEGYEYVLVWSLSIGTAAGEDAETFRISASKERQAEALIEAFRAELGLAEKKALNASVAMYVPVAPGSSVLNRAGLGTFGNLSDIPRPLNQIDLRAGDTLYRRAWWGEITTALGDPGNAIDTQAGFLLGERALAVLPIKQFGRESEPPWALVRVGISAKEAVADDELRPRPTHASLFG